MESGNTVIYGMTECEKQRVRLARDIEMALIYVKYGRAYQHSAQMRRQATAIKFDLRYYSKDSINGTMSLILGGTRAGNLKLVPYGSLGAIDVGIRGHCQKEVYHVGESSMPP